ncbi:MAG: permease [Candidatus Yonathbacteria bacterium CG_4_10_14_3_um_filter_47_65]|uniref:Permease n=2 Tax=Parcubacteria group TaxID=1794811 RepID=A0A2M8D725_9BACT|nr:MAG: hypothetical protein AUJ44_01260 [Candidatus Nomurabacteria bacterium CG1_02_47_685]PIP03493.1 MAG: permease [Candidatus Yonathbacteria bacterium CG23_combo_of_CG06-09_8_20_14_all_46_18]PIQ32943.1 MAG: permease [Candidatus Yonathbacteria bacterium CG17_big_fil_post_rev_8_21_14_2_50_46_19]PIX56164.1 MAG: permease [Candidatus Yonathbacteria bacterium CG_4_10_14_3_um_filter_47_65]PIY57634.1 MAG: permease [Candidatus Yonathbacteria bacterium CG_4_10_14_0_8_um_filter_47_645]PJB82905.1 MAG: 
MELSLGVLLVFSGAAITALLGFIGSAIGMEQAGKAAAAVTAEKPELFGKVLLMQALPGSQGIYSLVGAFLVLNFSGILGAQEAVNISTSVGLQYLIAVLPLGVSAIFSALLQGRVAVAGISTIAKDGALTTKAMILAAMVETWAIFGMLISFILLTSVK